MFRVAEKKIVLEEKVFTIGPTQKQNSPINNEMFLLNTCIYYAKFHGGEGMSIDSG